MSTSRHELRVAGLSVQIVRKPIKNLHLGVYPPNGRVRVAVPTAVSDQAVRLAVIGKLGWVKRQQAKFATQPRQTRREMVSGESHYYLGRRYRLRVVFRPGPERVVLLRRATLELQVRPGTDVERREQVLLRWYRQRLRELIPPLLERWEPKLGVHAAEWRIKRMKTKWGGCTVHARRIWLNLELAKKPVRCLEYLVVHELAHVIEPRHDARFMAVMDRHLPNWRTRRKELNAAPLGHDTWTL